MRGEGTLCLRGEESWPFSLGPKKTQRREKSGLKNFEITIFLIVTQDKPYKTHVTYIFERFYENFSTKCVNDSSQKEKPGRSKLSNKGWN